MEPPHLAAGPDDPAGVPPAPPAPGTVEAELRRLLQRDQLLLDHVQAGIVLHASDTRILYANPRATELLGVGADEALGAVNTDPRWQFTHEDGTPLPVEDYPVNTAVRTRAVVEDQVLGNRRHDDGTLVWLMCNAYPVLAPDGDVRQVVVTFTDVTDLKQAERALHASEQRLQLVLLGANDAAWDWDLVTGEVYFSPRWWQMVGLATDALPAGLELFHELVHPDDRDAVTAAIRGAVDSGASVYESEGRMRHADGHYVPVLSHGYVLRTTRAGPSGSPAPTPT